MHDFHERSMDRKLQYGSLIYQVTKKGKHGSETAIRFSDLPSHKKHHRDKNSNFNAQSLAKNPFLKTVEDICFLSAQKRIHFNKFQIIRFLN